MRIAVEAMALIAIVDSNLSGYMQEFQWIYARVCITADILRHGKWLVSNLVTQILWIVSDILNPIFIVFAVHY